MKTAPVLICTASNGKFTFFRMLKKRIGEERTMGDRVKNLFKTKELC